MRSEFKVFFSEMSFEYIINLDSKESTSLISTDLRASQLCASTTIVYIDWIDH